MSAIGPKASVGRTLGSNDGVVDPAQEDLMTSLSVQEPPTDVVSALGIGAQVLAVQAVALLAYCAVVVVKKPQYTGHPGAHSEIWGAVCLFGFLPAMVAGVLAALGRRAHRGLRYGSRAGVTLFALSLAAFALLMVYSYPTGPRGAEIPALVAFVVLSLIEAITAVITSAASPGSATRRRRDGFVAVASGVVIGGFVTLTVWSWLQEFFPSLT